ncbi:unnamed protein product [Toxocara canis]|uniref:SF3A3 domain-containing protein n=1 Tax=Toxocara canis TaxID=6265 RepID=A0A183VCB8_TOXCA|nr:unnamed protein product [Toxocara canis]
METVLETQRRLHEERDRLIDSMTKEFLHERKSHKEKINGDHRIKKLVDIAVPLSLEFQKMNEAIEDIEMAEKDLVEFTDEESYGRFLDMHTIFDKYVNVKGVKVRVFEVFFFVLRYVLIFDIRVINELTITIPPPPPPPPPPAFSPPLISFTSLRVDSYKQ